MKINVQSWAFNNMVAQFAHFGMAATILFTGALLAGQYFVCVVIGLLAWASVKELWFDPHFETKDGKPDVEDFLFYLAGMMFALVILQVHGHIMRWPTFAIH